MVTSPVDLTDEARFFLEPASPGQRQYEALRAYFVEQLSTEEVARRFGYTPGSLRVLCHHFRRQKPDWFRELKRGPSSQPKKGAARELILGMRKQNLSVYDIESALKDQQTPLSCTAIWEILREEGFSRLPRRRDEERPSRPRPESAEVDRGPRHRRAETERPPGGGTIETARHRFLADEGSPACHPLVAGSPETVTAAVH